MKQYGAGEMRDEGRNEAEEVAGEVAYEGGKKTRLGEEERRGDGG